jgi:hypothetical protein
MRGGMNNTGKIALLLMLLATVISTFLMARWRATAFEARTGLEASEERAKNLADEIDRLKSAAAQSNKTPDSKTRYVDVFPNNVPTLTKLIATTGDHLSVVADYCGYGSFSALERYAEYKNALIGVKARGKDVDLRIYEPDTAESMMARQFNLDKSSREDVFAALKLGPTYKAYFAYYKKIDKPRQEPENSGEFLKLMLNDEKECVQELLGKGIKVSRELKSQPPLFIWIRDSKEAMFSVYNLSSDAKEIALLTEDLGLVRLLADISANLGQ